MSRIWAEALRLIDIALASLTVRIQDRESPPDADDNPYDVFFEDADPDRET